MPLKSEKERELVQLVKDATPDQIEANEPDLKCTLERVGVKIETPYAFSRLIVITYVLRMYKK